eukprot:351951-Chlamydomonas_euryale.AAC.1
MGVWVDAFLGMPGLQRMPRRAAAVRSRALAAWSKMQCGALAVWSTCSVEHMECGAHGVRIAACPKTKGRHGRVVLLSEAAAIGRLGQRRASPRSCADTKHSSCVHAGGFILTPYHSVTVTVIVTVTGTNTVTVADAVAVTVTFAVIDTVLSLLLMLLLLLSLLLTPLLSLMLLLLLLLLLLLPL